jgi:hypothetical protein
MKPPWDRVLKEALPAVYIRLKAEDYELIVKSSKEQGLPCAMKTNQRRVAHSFAFFANEWG